ncbi:hypothetical protein [Mangrovibacterium sp.]|uniref:hypothetical protein n=1 Tax=Mangrovibacterium sp. TaxID=1961364 RepID=UPI00356A9685
MKPIQSLLALFLLVGVISCQYRAATEPFGISESVGESEISLGGVLADKINGFSPVDSIRSENQPKLIDEILQLQNEIGKMKHESDATVSADLSATWEEIRRTVDLSFETLAVADLRKWTEVNDSLLKHTGLVCYADELEKVFYNSQLAGVVSNEAVKSVCYTRRYDRIYVNIYNNSTFDFEHTTGGKIRLIQDTTFPNEGRIKLRVEMEDTRYLDLFVRIPGWSDMAAVTVKGVKYPVRPGEYTEIAKKWKNGDEIEIIVGMRPTVIRNDLNQLAFSYGALFLTYEKDSTTPEAVAVGDPAKDLQFVSPPGKMPTFTYGGIPDHTLVLQPFYAETDKGTRTVWIPNK